jgi:hypothetical protein
MTIHIHCSERDKAILDAAKRRARLSLSRFMLEGALRLAVTLSQPGARLADPLRRLMLERPDAEIEKCLKCKRELNVDNKTGFCRNCQRTVGLPDLRKVFKKELVERERAK